MAAILRFPEHVKQQIVKEYLSGKESGKVAKKYKCSAGYVRGLAFYHVNGFTAKLYRLGYERKNSDGNRARAARRERKQECREHQSYNGE